MHINSHMQL